MTSTNIATPKSICILRLSAIGDVCHAVSSVQALQRAYPEATITWVIGKVEEKLIGDLPGVDFVVFDKSKGWKAYRELQHSMKGRHFDILLHMQLAFRANLAAFFIPADRKIGFAKERSKELHSLFVGEHIQDSRGFHVLDGFRDFVRAIGVEDELPSWRIPIPHEAKAWAANYLPKEPFVVISPAASKAERNWLTERYAAIADYCHQLGYTVLLTGGPSESEKTICRSIAQETKAVTINLAGKTNLKQLLLTLQQAQLVIAPDSGPAHMAVTQSTPVIGLYAHSNPKRTGPYLYQRFIADAYTRKASEELGCSSDMIPWGYRLKGSDLMQNISVQEVKELITRAIDFYGLEQPLNEQAN
ncbi:glycosyltransferase family 9 protein [Kangiella sediminilitoris]|uniref:Glycosyl transferase family 9 n=1 Tax=Kangiella sediminilitoris TaxID=1144748 RepID=A0A1B3B870_9GAMM|nr:glycosyltransferase family 9 protein [Kangiella sediminilitoris]AOE48993.1 Glycosyl transferase family 9 [Kangiella sediminilitoris]